MTYRIYNGLELIADKEKWRGDLTVLPFVAIQHLFHELIIAMADFFGLADEDIYDAMINRSDEMSHICDIYKWKLAS